MDESVCKSPIELLQFLSNPDSADENPLTFDDDAALEQIHLFSHNVDDKNHCSISSTKA